MHKPSHHRSESSKKKNWIFIAKILITEMHFISPKLEIEFKSGMTKNIHGISLQSFTFSGLKSSSVKIVKNLIFLFVKFLLSSEWKFSQKKIAAEGP